VSDIQKMIGNILGYFFWEKAGCVLYTPKFSCFKASQSPSLAGIAD